ncbi:MAG TPA: hypothetical protein VFV58_33630 [Blastocatellia bacterium]|jgi:hypothetical protein|nr:hypothetical protein [Blastocatellia bacterium]
MRRSIQWAESCSDLWRSGWERVWRGVYDQTMNCPMRTPNASITIFTQLRREDNPSA